MRLKKWLLITIALVGLLLAQPITSSTASPKALDIATRGSISCASPTTERIDCFVVGDDKQVWQHSWQSGLGWGNWIGLGFPYFTIDTGGGVSAVARNGTTIDIFVSGKDGNFFNLYQRTWNGTTWSDWTSLGGPSSWDIYELSCTSASATNISCFVRASDNHLWQKTWNGSNWSTWGDLGAFTNGNPFKGLASSNYNTDGILLFAIGSDGHAYRRFYESDTWSGWLDDGGPTGSSFDQVNCQDQAGSKVTCAFTDTMGDVWYRTWESGWSTFTQLATPPSNGKGVAVAHYSSLGTVIVTNGFDGRLYRTFQPDPTSAWSSWLDDGRPQDLQIFLPMAIKPN